MKVGFALSPGGLLLPYHLGVLDTLQQKGRLVKEENPVAGSSAGAIATMAYGCGIALPKILEATISVSDTCEQLGGARGRLLPLLEEQMEALVGEEEFCQLQECQVGSIGIAYTQVFPRYQAFLQTDFDSRQELFQAVSWSCMFPFFATNWPCQLDTSSKNGIGIRLMVDGFFSVPRDRLGCPDFGEEVDRTIGVSVFPKEMVKLEAFDSDDCISPSLDDDSNGENLLRLATQASSREELTQVFEAGQRDADKWCGEELRRERKGEQEARELRRQEFY
jgi:hypothetical protein